ncbi:MAG: biotin--[acetyl-CoA-carboxylase] ligase, partial [Flavobacteriaceae bacterium]|nr:biotin--[acetyl-CoA-carboxylase] ligase [Eudoraea sp.]NNJ38217.1 biotin--[acetyl-CoA-carboxylase] ligase [Flavobacteriaceae bacterium]
TDSTNAYLKELLASKDAPDGTVVQAEWQQQGRGQMGRDWLSESGKNLTFSILKKFSSFPVTQQFLLNIISSLAVVEVLNTYNVPEIKVKWPNDIMSGNQKICGILVENVVKGRTLKAAVIGIGLNVNQEDFPSGLNATSMKLRTGSETALHTLLEAIVSSVEAAIETFLQAPYDEVRKAYEALLFGMEISSIFETREGQKFSATVKGIDETGQLRLQHDSGDVRAYQFNEIKMLFG